MIFCVVAGLILSMNTATMDGSRALYGISRDGMTIRQFGVLNQFNVPARAMTVDAILNIFLITAFAGVLEILAVSATWATSSPPARRCRPSSCSAATGRTGRVRSGCRTTGCRSAGVLFLINLTFLVVGGFLYSGGFLGIEGYGYGWDKTRTGLLVLLVALILYIWRHVVQDKIPMKLREQIPRTPEEERAHAELKVAPTAAPSA